MGMIIKKHFRETKSREVQIGRKSDWKRKVLRQLQTYKKVEKPLYDRLNLVK
jgi:hypothetical protein